jgi:hypothetical protein
MPSQTAQHSQVNLRQVSHLAVPFKGMGHVFLLRGDLCSLQCDAIGYSGDVHSRLSSTWRKALEEAGEGSWTEEASWPVDDKRRVRRLSGVAGGPKPYVVPVAGIATHEVGWYLDALRVFLLQATEDHKQAGKVPKLAIPLLGGGKGGKEQVQGELLQKTLEVLWGFTQERSVDVALVFDNQEGFDAAQWLRRQRGEVAWGALSEEHTAQADRLAAVASRGDMALFLGAGVSMAAGLPGWRSLLREASQGVLSPEEIAEAENLPVLDHAQLVAGLIGEAKLKEKVAGAIRAHKRPSLAHVLLAALPVNEIVTTNYDTLFEIAADKVKRPVHVIPYKGTLSRNIRWLMKLHGSIENPADIVLSRQTFLQYEASRAALAGLLAGLLVTRHVVFVGSSFGDDNVLRITEEVQRLGTPAAGGQPGQEPILGTNLAVGSPSVQKKLWQKDFHWIDLGNRETGGRTLEIFLDRLLAGTTTSASYLFNPHFDGALSAEDRQLRDQLTGLLKSTQTLRHPAVHALLQQLHERLGWKG